MLSKMKVEELKSFLRLRGLKVSGKKMELVARAFHAVENNAPILKSAEEVEGQLRDEYMEKLSVDNELINDPFQDEEGWLKEDESIVKWPLVTTFIIIKFLMLDSCIEDLNDYKSSKA